MMRRLPSRVRARTIALIIISAGIAAADTVVNTCQGSTYVGATIADASGSRNFVGAGLSNGTLSLAVTDTDREDNTSAASQPANRIVDPSITSFSATPRAYFNIDGTSYQVATAGQSWSLNAPDARTLRFEIRPGDHAWFDGGNVDRSQVERMPRISLGTPVNIAYQFMLEPGAANTASWVVSAEMHNDDKALGPNMHTSPPVHVGLAGEHLQVVAKYCPTGLDPRNAAGNLTNLVLWTDPNPIQRGQYYDIEIQANVDNTSNGYLDVWVNGVEVVSYHGPLGYGFATYWMEGLYRSADAFQTLAANFRNLIITGSR